MESILALESKDSPVIHVYKRRWLVLALYSSYVVLQYFIWNVFCTVASSLKKTFGWHNGDVALLAIWDVILFIVLGLQASWLLQNKGLRKCILFCLCMVIIGSAVRCIPLGEDSAIWILSVGQFFNAMGGIFAQSAGTFLSSTWFPPGERATSTSISSLCSSLGIARSFFVGPLVVPDLNQTPNDREVMKDQLELLQYWLLGVAVILSIAAVCWLKEKPNLPPSNSALLVKTAFKPGLLELLKKRSYWPLLLIASAVTGAYSGWTSVLAMNFTGTQLPVTQTDCGWIGFSSTLFSVAGGIVFGRLADIFAGHLKTILVILYIAASGAFTCIILMCYGVLPYQKEGLFLACIVAGCSINGSVPLLYELVVEMTFPVPDTVSVGTVALINNVFSLIFLLVIGIPDIGVAWMNWCVLAICVVSVFLLLITKVEYRRHNFDTVYANQHANDLSA